MSDPELFGKLLRVERKKAGKTQRQVSQMLGIKVPYLSDIELGKRYPLSAERIVNVARFLGCDPTPLALASMASRGTIELGAKSANVARILVQLAYVGDALPTRTLAKIENLIKRGAP